MERQSADLSTAPGSCRRYDSRRRAQRRRSAVVGAQCRGRIPGQSPHRSQGLSTTGRRGVGRDQARTRHVRQSRRARSSAQRRTTEVSYRPMARNRRNDSAARDHTQRITQSGEDYESKMRSPNLRNAALILSLSGSASLRETSAIQGREEVFTLRRQGAKRRNQSKHQRFFGHTIGDPLNAVFDHVLAEIDEEAESFIHQPQIGQDLFAVNRIECRDRFHFHDHAIVDDQVGAKAFVEPDPIPRDRNRYLSFHGVAVFAQFMRKQDFVYDFEDAWPEPSVQAIGSVNDHSRDFILFHTAKLVLLLSACEAKNFSAVLSLRENSATQSQEKFFTPTREDAKEVFKSKSLVPSLDLGAFASLREISARQGKEEFFSLRREGAKKAYESKGPSSALRLRGFASLRQTALKQGREQVSTLRREGAEKRCESKSPVSSPNLSGFASL